MKYTNTYFDDVKVGDELPPLVKGRCTRSSSRATRGLRRLQPDPPGPRVRQGGGMNDVFAHGMLSMGFVGQLVTDWAGAGNVRKLGVRFAGIVRLKDTITCRGRVLAKSGKDLVDLEIWAENQRGEKVVTGKATVAIPPRG
jgi:hypothetical protein